MESSQIDQYGVLKLPTESTIVDSDMRTAETHLNDSVDEGVQVIVNSGFHCVNANQTSSSSVSSNSQTSSVDEESSIANSHPTESIYGAYFEKQPPNNLRKSNFFNFELIFTDDSKNPQVIESARFIGFCEQTPEDLQLRNGIIYQIRFTPKNGEKREEKFMVRLIDSVTKKPISYDGQDKNPDMCRVLLTHEVMCSRCCESKSCGNRNETPSDPVILANKLTCRFHMKCNQNCLKNAGNPRETRRFQVMIAKFMSASATSETNMGRKVLATSESMFVHNNSKHGRRPNGSTENHGESYHGTRNGISVNLVIPKEGRVTGFEEVAIIGENFHEGLQVVFGNQLSLNTEVISPSLIKALTPCSNFVGNVDVKFMYNHKPMNLVPAFYFKYRADYVPQYDPYLEKLWILLPKSTPEFEIPSKECILKRACEFMELMYTQPPSTPGSCPPLSLDRNAVPQAISSAPTKEMNTGMINSDIYLLNQNQSYSNGYGMGHLDEVFKGNMMVNQPQPMTSVSGDNLMSQLVNAHQMDNSSLISNKNKLCSVRKRQMLPNGNGVKFDEQHSKPVDSMYPPRSKNGLCSNQATINNMFSMQNRTEEQAANVSSFPGSNQLFINLNSGMNGNQVQFCDVMDGTQYSNEPDRHMNGMGNFKTQNSFTDGRNLNYLLNTSRDSQNFDLKQLVNGYTPHNQQCKQTPGSINQSHQPYNLQSICSDQNNFNHFTATQKRI